MSSIHVFFLYFNAPTENYDGTSNISPEMKSGNSSSIHLHDFVFQLLIFPGCTYKNDDKNQLKSPEVWWPLSSLKGRVNPMQIANEPSWPNWCILAIQWDGLTLRLASCLSEVPPLK